MADIHTFPAHFNVEAVRRVTEKLSAAFHSGQDLGSRLPHIQAIAENLERTLIDLDREIDALVTILSPREVDMLLRKSGFEAMRNRLKELIASARNFPTRERE